MYGKYEHKKKLQLQRQFYFDTTDLDPYETEAAPGKNIDN